MSRPFAITIGTSGYADWIEMPDGRRFLLGPVSILDVVRKSAVKRNDIQRVLETILQDGKAMFIADMDRLEPLFQAHRSRWATDISLITQEERTHYVASGDMSNFDKSYKEAVKDQIAEIEEQISLLNEKIREAEEGSLSDQMMRDEIEHLRNLVQELRNPPTEGQSDNSAFYGLSEPKTASFDTFKSNAALVEEILDKVGSTSVKVDRLVALGKRFASDRVKQDLYRIAGHVTEIVRDVDLANEWVSKELFKLAEEADRIYDLFAKAKE